MVCESCGVERLAMKTVRWRTGKRRFVLCDECWEPLAASLWIVPGDFSITARCDRCRDYLNPSELVTITPGGATKRDIIASGVCRDCSGVRQ